MKCLRRIHRHVTALSFLVIVFCMPCVAKFFLGSLSFCAEKLPLRVRVRLLCVRDRLCVGLLCYSGLEI